MLIRMSFIDNFVGNLRKISYKALKLCVVKLDGTKMKLSLTQK